MRRFFMLCTAKYPDRNHHAFCSERQRIQEMRLIEHQRSFEIRKRERKNRGHAAPWCKPLRLLLKKKCLPAAYNAPAGIDVKGWDLDVFGEFIYWHVSQDSMDSRPRYCRPARLRL